ncbi:hypothetical protein LJC48_07575, partial [Desulfovibrio sp. OttesenSCG-928-C06]|nr:hypothetical protein [Desulfovibrio sp. OttesenSCG-928-C06]
MSLLSEFAYLPIDWQMTPEHAVTMYLEWGNNDWHSEYPPVRSKEDYSIYFVVDTWGEKPVVRLVKRNSEQADDLISLELPAHLQAGWQAEYPGLRGIFEPTDEIKNWLKQE